MEILSLVNYIDLLVISPGHDLFYCDPPGLFHNLRHYQGASTCGFFNSVFFIEKQYYVYIMKYELG